MPQALSIPGHGYGLRHTSSSGQASPDQNRHAQESETGSLSFKLLIVFIVLLFSNAAQMFPALDAVRPAQTVGGLALLSLIYEKFAHGERFDFARPDGYLLAGFLAAVGLSIFGAVWPDYAFQSALDLAKVVVIYFLIVNAANSEKRVRALLWVMVLGGLFPALGSLWNWQHQIRVEGRAGWIGIFANPNEMAYSLVILIPPAIMLASRLPLLPRILTWSMVAIFVVAIYLSFSRGSLIGLGVVGAYLGLRQKSGLARVAVIGLLVAGTLAASMYWSRDVGFNNVQGDANFNERLTTYQVAWAMYSSSPLLGVGINCSAVAWPLFAPAQLNHHKWLITHNTFIQALSETGTIGFLLFASFLGAVLCKAWKAGRSDRAPERLREVGAALEISFWGFLVCGMTGGYVMSWFPYLLAGAIGANGARMAEE
jgi:O-antigen ligase